MKALQIKDECTVVLRDLETGEIVDLFKSATNRAAASEDEIEGQLSLFKEDDSDALD